MINRSVQCFLTDTYGREKWDAIAASAGLDFAGFEPMLEYDPILTEAVLQAAAQVLGKPRQMILEDIGTYLVSHENMQMIRRLLRFGGANFVAFLYSLDELPDRARLALPDLDLPALELEETDTASFTLRVRNGPDGFAYVLMGVLRALADDYGALVLLEFDERRGDTETISIQLAETAFSEGRRFDLRRRTG
ncbi:heme NO-binding domain-containing protein [Pseudoruegeria sp. HB172150]|uniref:heme NO-binding domain-containing protein n=1 Tax=Pseudoruegeria sp. HB172150 TaxID=2721164 RepID=UPI001C1326E1|nr:heme NO-binding domain-containing protein [Pseudoruegeria sp. HB172150]